MRIEKDFVLREIAGEYVIVPTGKTVLEFNGLITVNEAGVLIWKLLQKGVSFDEIVEEILREYDVEESVVREDVLDFLDQLEKGGILVTDCDEN